MWKFYFSSCFSETKFTPAYMILQPRFKLQLSQSYKRDLVANTSLTFVPTSMQKLCNSNLPIGNSVQIHNTNSGMPRYVYDYHNFSQAKANCSACQTNAVCARQLMFGDTRRHNEEKSTLFVQWQDCNNTQQQKKIIIITKTIMCIKLALLVASNCNCWQVSEGNICRYI